MILNFANEYYNGTKHKLVVVHAAYGGQPISMYLPNAGAKLIYEAMVLKYQMAVDYVSSLGSYYKIGKKFYVVYQGENDTYSAENANAYKATYLQVHENLINDLDLSFGALVYISRGSADDNLNNQYIQTIRSAQMELVAENDDIIMASDFPYQQLISNNRTILCPVGNVIHINASGLSQVGKDAAHSIIDSGLLNN